MECDHGVEFDDAAYDTRMSPEYVREEWPRLDGECPLGCGYVGIAYASMMHYVAGDW